MRFVIVSVAAAALLPFVWLLLSGWPSRSSPARWGAGWDNHDVPGSIARLQGWRRRAHFAQLNAHEAFAPFAAAMILAELAPAPTTSVHALGAAFLVLRGLHGVCYVADLALWRSLIWFAAAFALLGLFAIALVSAV
jgi:uncharacterized MAPEG superfamily protein